MAKMERYIMTDAEVTQAAVGRFMTKSCGQSKFTLINGRQLDEFQTAGSWTSFKRTTSSCRSTRKRHT